MSHVSHSKLGAIECIRSLRNRSIRLAVRGDGTLRLSFPLFTSRREAIAFAERKAEWIDNTRRRIAQRQQCYPTISGSEVEKLRKDAKRAIPELVARLADARGFRYKSLRISKARTRWGSCSGENVISLSLFVMLLPDHLREFIILHELCHTRYHNHSEAFHRLLNECVGGREREYNRELKAWHIPIIKD